MNLPNGDSDQNFSRAINSNFELPPASVVGVSENHSNGMACGSLSSSSGMAWERRHMGEERDMGFGQKVVGEDNGKRVGKDFFGEPMSR